MLLIIKGANDNQLPWGKYAQYTYNKFGQCKWTGSDFLVTTDAAGANAQSEIVIKLRNSCYFVVSFV